MPVVNGIVLGETPYVEVRWEWLLFLTLQVVLSAVFLGSTILLTKETSMPIVKSSSLATLCGLDLDVEMRGELGPDLASAQKAAGMMRMTLERMPSGVGFCLKKI